MKRFAVAAVTVVALVALIVAALPFIIPGNLLRDLIASRITTLTGRTVVVDGSPRLSIYPELAISIDSLTITNPDTIGDEAFVSAEGVRASIRPLTLFLGRVEFNDFELIRPRFRFVVLQDGSTNWDLSQGAIARQAIRVAARAAEAASTQAESGAEDATAPSPPTIEGVRIGRITVTDGIILYDDLRADHREEMTDVDLDVAWLTAMTSATFAGAFDWRGERVQINGSIREPARLISGGPTAMRLAVAATTIRATFAGEAQTGPVPLLSGQAVVATPSMRRTLTWLGTPMEPGATLGAGSIEGTVTAIATSFTIDPARVELDGMRADGSLTIALRDAGAGVSGTLASERLDLTAYLEAARADITGAGPWPLAPTRLPFTDALDVDLQFTAAEVTAGATRLGRVAGTVLTNQGAIDLRLDEGQLYGGTITGQAHAAMMADELIVSVEARMSEVPVRAAFAELAGTDGLDGTAAASAALSGRGKTWGELARSMTGSASVDIARGTIAQDLNAVAVAMADPLAEAIEPAGGETSFSSLAATLAVAGGILSTEDLSLEGVGIDVSLSGTGSVVTGLVDAGALLASGEFEAPVRITGSWWKPVVARDAVPDAVGVEAGAAGPTGG